MNSVELLKDPEFLSQYERAVEGLSEEDLLSVARLTPDQLFEWVYSPATVRPHKLEAMRKAHSAPTEIERLGRATSEAVRKLATYEIPKERADQIREAIRRPRMEVPGGKKSLWARIKEQVS